MKPAALCAVIFVSATILVCRAHQEIPREEATTVESLAGHGFVIKWARGGVRVRATSLDGNGVFECSELVVMKRDIRWFDADADAVRSPDVVRRELSTEDEYVFVLSDEEMSRSIVVITYEAERDREGRSVDRVFYCATSLLLGKKANQTSEPTPSGVAHR